MMTTTVKTAKTTPRRIVKIRLH